MRRKADIKNKAQAIFDIMFFGLIVISRRFFIFSAPFDAIIALRKESCNERVIDIIYRKKEAITYGTF